MKKTINIHISRQAFIIEEVAYDKLSLWLDSVKKQLENETGCNEIMDDIELRAAELFLEDSKSATEVITESQVERVISVMGKPEDFQADEDEENQLEKGDYLKSNMKNVRRLYRDTDDRILGGVSGGLGKYFSVDAIIFRILFVILTFVGGVGPIIYILFWIFVPPAVSGTQKLEMRGDRVTINNIEKMVSKEIDGLKKSWKKNEYMSRAESAVAGLAEILKVVFKIALYIVGFILFMYGIVGIAAVVSTVFFDQLFFITNDISGFISPKHFFSLFAETGEVSSLLFSAGFLAFLVFLSLAYVGSKLLFRFKSNNKLFFIVTISLFIIASVFTGLNSALIFSKYKEEISTIDKEVVSYTTGDTLIVKMSSGYDNNFSIANIDWGKYRIVTQGGKTTKLYGIPEFDIEKSNDGTVFLHSKYEIRGLSDEQVKRKSYYKYNWEQKGKELLFDPYFDTMEKDKFYFEELELSLKVPVGTYVYLDPAIEPIVWDIMNEENIWDHDMMGKYWYMSEQGLVEAK